MVEIVLDWPEILQAANVGMLRRVESLRRGKGSSMSTKEDFWDIDIEGAAAEMVVAKFLGVYWSFSVNSFKRPDLPYQIQVRSIRSEGHSLILRPKDNDEHIYVLVCGRAPTYQVVGWIFGKEGRSREFIKNPNGKAPAWFVPTNRLRPIETLVPMLMENALAQQSGTPAEA